MHRENVRDGDFAVGKWLNEASSWGVQHQFIINPLYL